MRIAFFLCGFLLLGSTCAMWQKPITQRSASLQERRRPHLGRFFDVIQQELEELIQHEQQGRHRIKMIEKFATELREALEAKNLSRSVLARKGLLEDPHGEIQKITTPTFQWKMNREGRKADRELAREQALFTYDFDTQLDQLKRIYDPSTPRNTRITFGPTTGKPIPARYNLLVEGLQEEINTGKMSLQEAQRLLSRLNVLTDLSTLPEFTLPSALSPEIEDELRQRNLLDAAIEGLTKTAEHFHYPPQGGVGWRLDPSEFAISSDISDPDLTGKIVSEFEEHLKKQSPTNLFDIEQGETL